MEILMSEAAFARIGAATRARAPGAVITTLGPQGRLARGGEPLEPALCDPHVFYASLDLHEAGLLRDFFSHMLRGRSGRWAQIFSAGVDDPVFARLMDKGLRLAKSSAQAPAIADYVLAHALGLLHPIEAQRALQVERRWLPVPFREISATRWLLVGLGPIGREVAARLAPFGPEILAVRRTPAPDPLLAEVADAAALPRLLPTADVVVLACALNPDTRGLAGEAFFRALKPGAVLINVARGAVVDEEALKAGLERDQPARAVLDVFGVEPLPADSWIWSHPKIAVTAHGSNLGDRVAERLDALFLANLERMLLGETLVNEADRRDAGGGRE